MNRITTFLVVISLFLLTTVAFAQPSNRPANPAGSGMGGPAGGGPNNPRVPIDGGLSILLLAGGALGAKRMYDNFREDD